MTKNIDEMAREELVEAVNEKLANYLRLVRAPSWDWPAMIRAYREVSDLIDGALRAQRRLEASRTERRQGVRVATPGVPIGPKSRDELAEELAGLREAHYELMDLYCAHLGAVCIALKATGARTDGLVEELVDMFTDQPG